MINSILTNHYAQLTDLSLAARSSRRIIAQAIEQGLKDDHLKQSYLTLCLCTQEYCRATNLSVNRFGLDEFETIQIYYNRLVIEHPDQNLMIVAIHEIRPILEKVGGSIRSIISAEEL
jgi:hypothetical protein